MVDSMRFIISETAGFIYLVKMIGKWLEWRSASRNGSSRTAGTFTADEIRSQQKKRIQTLRWEFIRLAAQAILFQCFMVTDAYGGYIHLFSPVQAEKSYIGYYGAWCFLILLTLLISIGVDWVFLRHIQLRRKVSSDEFDHFMRREALSMMFISGLLILPLFVTAMIVFLPSGSFREPLLLFMLFLPFCLWLFHSVRKLRRRKKPVDAETLHEALPALLDRHGIKSVALITKPGRYSQVKIRIAGLIHKRLEIDRRCILCMEPDEVYAAVMQCLETSRKVRIWKACCFGLLILCFLLLILSPIWNLINRSSVPGIPADISRMVSCKDALWISIFIIYGTLDFLAYRLLRNLVTRRLLFRADQATAEAGYRKELANALHQFADYEEQTLPYICRLFSRNPLFINERILRLARMEGAPEKARHCGRTDSLV